MRSLPKRGINVLNLIKGIILFVLGGHLAQLSD